MSFLDAVSGRGMEASESAATLMTNRSGSSNGSLQPASPEMLSGMNTRDSLLNMGSRASVREGSGNSTGSSMNGHKHPDEDNK